MEPIGGIGFGVGVGADDKIAVKPLSVGVGRLGLPIRIIILHKKKDTKKKEISTSNILPECYSL
jgi:hypothetical protein